MDSDLSGHVEIHVPGVDMSSGSLGQGLSVALGMAMYAKARKKDIGLSVFLETVKSRKGRYRAAVCQIL